MSPPRGGTTRLGADGAAGVGAGEDGGVAVERLVVLEGRVATLVPAAGRALLALGGGGAAAPWRGGRRPGWRRPGRAPAAARRPPRARRRRPAPRCGWWGERKFSWGPPGRGWAAALRYHPFGAGAGAGLVISQVLPRSERPERQQASPTRAKRTKRTSRPRNVASEEQPVRHPGGARDEARHVEDGVGHRAEGDQPGERAPAVRGQPLQPPHGRPGPALDRQHGAALRPDPPAGRLPQRRARPRRAARRAGAARPPSSAAGRRGCRGRGRRG